MSRKRKRTYFAVMIVGGLALVVDRCVPSDGTLDPVAAVARVPGDSPTPASARPGETPPASSIPELPFPRDIELYDPDSPIPDLFTPPESVLPRDATDGAAGKATQDGERNTSVVGAARATFRLKHRLTGVLIDERLRIAIVDGMWVRVGQSLDGCVLSAVSGNQARFACHDGESVLEITDGSAGVRD
jgi:hypothetical protein